MDFFETECHSETETRQLAARLAGSLDAGLTIALNGQLGSGKTHLVRFVCEALGVPENTVNSPTFVLMQVYSGDSRDIFHFDTYRLSDPDEFLAIGGEDYLLDTEAVCFVEWAERIQDILPADRLDVTIEQTSATSRKFRFSARGPVSRQLLTRLAAESCS